jgi:ABC-2 type transport system permease protein
MQAAEAMKGNAALDGLKSAMQSINIPLLAGCFLFYFLGGYLLYSSLFAAIGSAVNEDPQDAQSLMLPVTMPIIFSIVIMMKTVNDPNSSLAVFGSIFPLTSPVVMMARVAHGVPEGVSVLELMISAILLIGGFIFTTWMAGKIYRTGILLYGKKPSWKEMWKWAFRSN